MSKRVDKAIAVGLLAAVVCTALTQGAVEAWSVAIFELVVVSLLLMWAVKCVTEREVALRVPGAGVAMAMFVALGLVQGIKQSSGADPWSVLSMDAEATRAAVTVLFFLLISYLIAANLFTSRERSRSVVGFLLFYGFALAVLALIQSFAWDGRFFWLRPTKLQQAFGPFGNRNHFAGYIEMLFGLPIALILTGQGRREFRLFCAFAASVMGVSVVASLSRGGMIGLVASIMFILFVSGGLPKHAGPAGERRRLPFYIPQTVAVAAIVGSITVGILWVGAAPVIERVTATVDGGESGEAAPASLNRSVIWGDTWAIFKDSPVFGAGLGAFQTVYPIHSRSDGSVIVAQAHNDYLQVLADAGIVGGLIALSFIILVFRSVARGLRSRNSFDAAVAAGSGAGIFAMLVHSLFDFNLQLPSNALLFLVLSAMAAGASSLAAHLPSSGRQHPPVSAGGYS